VFRFEPHPCIYYSIYSSTTIIFNMSVPYECYVCSNLRPFFTDDRSCYTTHEAIFLIPWAFQATLLYSYYPLWNHFEPPTIISFVVTKWRIMSQVLNLNVIYLISHRVIYNISQLIQDIFLIFSLSPQKQLLKIDSIDEMIHAGALNKERK